MSDGRDTVRLRLRYPDVDTFIQRFAPNVTRGGVFIASREPRPVGSVVRFEIALADGIPLLSGEGRVTWVREFDPSAPTKAHGMGVQFTNVDAAARPMLERLLEARGGGSQPKPMPQSRPRVPSAVPARATSAIPSAPMTVTPSGPAVDPSAFRDFDEGVEESAIRRARDFAKIVSAKEDELDDLLKPDQEEQKVTLEEALQGLPQFLQSRRKTGLWRTLPPEDSGPRETKQDPGEKPGDDPERT